MTTEMMHAFMRKQKSPEVLSMWEWYSLCKSRIDQYNRSPRHIKCSLTTHRMIRNVENGNMTIWIYILCLCFPIADQTGHHYSGYA